MRGTANLCTKILDFRGFESSLILTLRGGILMPMGSFPESSSRAISAGRFLVGRLDRIKEMMLLLLLIIIMNMVIIQLIMDMVPDGEFSEAHLVRQRLRATRAREQNPHNLPTNIIPTNIIPTKTR